MVDLGFESLVGLLHFDQVSVALEIPVEEVEEFESVLLLEQVLFELLWSYVLSFILFHVEEDQAGHFLLDGVFWDLSVTVLHQKELFVPLKVDHLIELDQVLQVEGLFFLRDHFEQKGNFLLRISVEQELALLHEALEVNESSVVFVGDVEHGLGDLLVRIQVQRLEQLSELLHSHEVVGLLRDALVLVVERSQFFIVHVLEFRPLPHQKNCLGKKHFLLLFSVATKHIIFLNFHSLFSHIFFHRGLLRALLSLLLRPLPLPPSLFLFLLPLPVLLHVLATLLSLSLTSLLLWFLLLSLLLPVLLLFFLLILRLFFLLSWFFLGVASFEVEAVFFLGKNVTKFPLGVLSEVVQGVLPFWFRHVEAHFPRLNLRLLFFFQDDSDVRGLSRTHQTILPLVEYRKHSE